MEREQDRVAEPWTQVRAPGPVPATVDTPPGARAPHGDPAPPTRIGAAERNRAEQRLRGALRDDVISIMEYDDRLGLVMAARVQSDLDEIVADLPAPQFPPPAPSASPPRGRARRWLVAFMSGNTESGRWQPAPSVNAVAFMGGVQVDLQEAEVRRFEQDINAFAFMGGVEIIVPDGVEVDMTGFAFMGGRVNKVRNPDDPNAPLLRVRAYAFMGGVDVRGPRVRDKINGRVPLAPWADDEPSSPPAERAGRGPRRGWGGRIAGVALLVGLALGPGRAIATADAIAVFGSQDYRPSTEELQDEDEVRTFTMFGSVHVIVPDTHRAEHDGFALFGSAHCEEVCQRPATLPTVEVKSYALFGSADVVPIDSEELPDD